MIQFKKSMSLIRTIFVAAPCAAASARLPTIVIIIIIHAFITHSSSVMMLNQRRWQSLGGQHGKDVNRLFEKVSFQTAFEGVESG